MTPALMELLVLDNTFLGTFIPPEEDYMITESGILMVTEDGSYMDTE